MTALRRSGTLVALVALVGALASGPAQGATPNDFVATGTGRALNLSLLGQSTTLGVTNATIKSAMSAASGAAGQLLNLATTTAANVTQNNTTLLDPLTGALKCGPLSLPSVLGLLSVSTACSQSKASITNGLPLAHGEGQVAEIDLGVNSLLKSANTGVPLGSTLTGILAPVLNLLGQQGNSNAAALSPTNTITDLLNAITSTKTLSITIGKSVSDLTTSGSNITSTVTSQGGEIDLLPIPVLNTPLASIVIGSATATATQDKATGNGTANYDPSIVTVKLAPVLGLPATTIPLRPGQTITILQGTPLESTITLGDGKTDNAKNSSKAMADGVSLQLLKGLALPSLTGSSSTASAAATGASSAPTGGIVLELAHAEAAVATQPVAPAPAPVVQAPKQLPFTGAPRWLGLLGFALVAAGFGTRRVLRSARA